MKRPALVNCTAAARIIATIGICKNAGKTTVLNYLLASMHEKYCIGITSIGYDGEETDFVTLLPKPKVTVYPGMYVATSSACLEKTDVNYDLICDTGFKTPVGSVSIVNIRSEGTIEVSGPSIASQIKKVDDLMLELGCHKIIADGAAGRLSYAAYADASILSIGAAVSTDIEKVVLRAKHAVEMLSLKSYIKNETEDGLVFTFRGAMADKDLSAIMSEHRDVSVLKTAVVKDAAAIFINPRTYDKFRKKHGEIRVCNPIKLAALTINPMSPYGEWFDAIEFKSRIQAISSLPVFNMKEEQEVISEK
ncbi:MAG TPA: hypothetical protein DCO79_02175 [Spirochaeta sp.]|nr:hypothetical protein [Spirochaeta sp.]